jgi:hypothetical protein
MRVFLFQNLFVMVVIASTVAFSSGHEIKFPTPSALGSRANMDCVVASSLCGSDCDSTQNALSLALAENEVLKRQLEELKSVTHERPKSSTHEDLLKFTNTLRIMRANEARIIECLLHLSNLARLLSKHVSVSDGARIEKALREVDEVVGYKVIEESSISVKGKTSHVSVIGKITAVNLGLGCIVVNLGENSSLQLGAPLKVKRQGELIGQARVVEVRQKFSGAVVVTSVRDVFDFKTGDVVEVDSSF